MSRSRLLRPFACGARSLLASLLLSSPALALELSLSPPEPTELGAETTFTIEVKDAVGTPQIRWTFGDGTQTEFVEGATTVTHTFTEPGHYSLLVLAQDEQGYASQALVHAVHRPLTEEPPQSATSIILDPERDLILTANADNGTVTLIDKKTLEKTAEIAVFSHPIGLALAPDGLLWVLDQDNYAIAIVDVDAQKMVDFFRLPYASLPSGLAFAPGGDAFVTLTALGAIARIDPDSHEVTVQKQVAPWLRGLAVSGDGSSLYATRFISSGDHGEVFRIDAETLTSEHRFDLMIDTTTEDSDVQGRGLPNYLFSVAVTPDGTQAWIPSKKDNMPRGLTRDGLELTQDTAVRPLVSILDLEGDMELIGERIDLDDRNLPTHVTFSEKGDWAFITVFGSNLVELRDAFTGSFITALRAEGMFGPVATVLDDEGHLFVFADLARKVFVFDVVDLMNGVDQSAPLLTSISLVEKDKLSEELLRGKQVFANAEDKRMASEGYLSCSSCHFDGFEDAMVWDFTDRGEGIRNSISLLGRRGTGHGRVHWSANFDEIQDFDGPIRAHQAGLGFIAREDFEAVADPLGPPKAGLDPDLDALATYVASLDRIPRSPFRNADGTLTEDAEKGRALFLALGCDSCHKGEDFTDSPEGKLHDVGTLTELSGGRLGGELSGLDTPTLLGIWQTAPYLHDGSATTLRDVLITRNPEGKHGDTASLSEAELGQLIAYLEQLDQGLPPQELSLPGEEPSGSGGAPTGSGGSSSGGDESGGSTGVTTGGDAPSGTGGGADRPSVPSGSSGGCSVTKSTQRSGQQALLCAALIGFVALRRTRRAGRS